MSVLLAYLIAATIFVTIFTVLGAALPRIEALFITMLDARERRAASRVAMPGPVSKLAGSVN